MDVDAMACDFMPTSKVDKNDGMGYSDENDVSAHDDNYYINNEIIGIEKTDETDAEFVNIPVPVQVSSNLVNNDPADWNELGGMVFMENDYCRTCLKALYAQTKSATHFCDTVIVCNNKNFPVHSCIIACASPVISNKLMQLRCDSPKSLKLKCTSANAVEVLIHYIYCGTLTVCESLVIDIVEAARELHLQNPIEYCKEFLRKATTNKSCYKVLELAQKGKLHDLVRHIENFVICNIQKVIYEESILDVTQRQIFDILKSVTYVLSDQQKLELIVRWIKHSCCDRKRLLPQMLMTLKLGMVSSDYLAGLVAIDDLFVTDDWCSYHLLVALENNKIDTFNHADKLTNLKKRIFNSLVDDSAIARRTPTKVDNCELAVCDDEQMAKSSINISLTGDICSEQVEQTGVEYDGEAIVGDVVLNEEEHKLQVLDVKQENIVTSVPSQFDERLDILSAVCNEVTVDEEYLRSEKEREPSEGGGGSSSAFQSLGGEHEVVTCCAYGSSNEKDDRHIGIVNAKIECVSDGDSQLKLPRKKRKTFKRLQIEMEEPLQVKNRQKRMSSQALNAEKSRGRPLYKLYSGKKESDNRNKLNCLSQVVEGNLISESNRSYQRICPETNCKRVFDLKDDFENHIKETHPGYRIYRCDKCETTFMWNREYYFHMRKHFGSGPYKCDFEHCDYTAEKIQSFLNHRMVHLDERPYICSACKRDFRAKCTLINHVRQHTGEHPFSCTFCSKKFPTKASMRTHMLSHSDKKFNCDICDFTTKYASHLTTHKKIHAGDLFRCTFENCEYATPKRNLLGYHTRIHQAIRNYKCDQCDRCFIEKSHLTRHKLTHLTEKPFKCESCTYSSSRSDKLKEHTAKHHGDNPPKSSVKKKRIQCANQAISQANQLLKVGLHQLKNVNVENTCLQLLVPMGETGSQKLTAVSLSGELPNQSNPVAIESAGSATPLSATQSQVLMTLF